MRIDDQTRNRLKVLKAIRRHGPVSRSELPRLTGLSGGTITQLTADLARRSLIAESRGTGSRLGRPRTYLEINAAGGIVLGVSIRGVGVLEIRFVDLLGEELFKHDAKLGVAKSLEAFMLRIAEGIAEAIELSPFDVPELGRVGLALPGLVDTERGTLHFMTLYPAGPVPAATIVSERIGLPVTIENDQACMARAIHWFGAAEHLDTFTLIQVSYSVATAEYADGLPKSGANGLNPEIGHMKTAFGEQSRACHCGGKGCVSAYSSLYGILAQTELLDGMEFPALKRMDPLFETLLDQAEAGDRTATRLLDQAAEHLGYAVANYLTVSDPGIVLIAVPSRRILDRLEPRFWLALRANTMPGILPVTEVRFLLTDPAWRSSGTAALALEQAYLGDFR